MEIEAGQKCRILEIGNKCSRIREMGLNEGDVVEKMVDNDGVIVKTGETTLALCRRISEKIIVEKV